MIANLPVLHPPVYILLPAYPNHRSGSGEYRKMILLNLIQKDIYYTEIIVELKYNWSIFLSTYLARTFYTVYTIYFPLSEHMKV